MAPIPGPKENEMQTNPNEFTWKEAREMGLDAAPADMVPDEGEPEA